MQFGGGGNVLKSAPDNVYGNTIPQGGERSYADQSSLLPDNYQFPTGVKTPPINYGF